MATNTIPEPTEDQRKTALFGVRLQAEAHGLDVEDEKVKAFIEHTAEVQSWMASESTWLNNIIHKYTLNEMG